MDAGCRPAESAPVGLTELECAVLRFIAQGATAREAGAADDENVHAISRG
jgi:hypothetical protein